MDITQAEINRYKNEMAAARKKAMKDFDDGVPLESYVVPARISAGGVAVGAAVEGVRMVYLAENGVILTNAELLDETAKIISEKNPALTPKEVQEKLLSGEETINSYKLNRTDIEQRLATRLKTSCPESTDAAIKNSIDDFFEAANKGKGIPHSSEVSKHIQAFENASEELRVRPDKSLAGKISKGVKNAGRAVKTRPVIQGARATGIITTVMAAAYAGWQWIKGDDVEERATEAQNAAKVRAGILSAEQTVDSCAQTFSAQSDASNPANDVYIEARSHLRINGQLSTSTTGLITDELGIMPEQQTGGANLLEQNRNDYVNTVMRAKQLELERQLRDRMIQQQGSQASNTGLNNTLDANSAGGVSTQDTGLAINNTNQQTMG